MIPHPNATIGLTSTTGGGALIIELAHLAGWAISPFASVAIAGAVTWLVLAVGRVGMAGVYRGLRDGFTTKPAAKA